MAFANGKMFIAASNPTLNKAGVNVFPALDTVAFSGHTVVLTPVLRGHAPAKDLTTGSTVSLNEIDPDSLMLDNSGDVVLDNQGGSELVFLHDAGLPQQTVSRLPLGTQVDDVAWITAAKGRLLIVDGKTNTIYVVRAAFKPGAVYAEAPSDSGVAGFVGTLDLKTGTLRPVMVGFGSPTGLLFVPGAQL
jgi:hypothetical protein